MNIDEILKFKTLDPDVRAALEYAEQLQSDFDEKADKLKTLAAVLPVLEALEKRIDGLQPDTIASGLLHAAITMLEQID